MEKVTWEVNQKVVSNDAASKGLQGTIWKITEKAVHVRFGSGMDVSFQKFHFVPTHHSQSTIEDLKPC